MAGALIVAISGTRLYFGAHYPIDVLGGWIAGFALVSILVAIHVLRVDERARAREATRRSAVGTRRVAVPRREPQPSAATETIEG